MWHMNNIIKHIKALISSGFSQAEIAKLAGTTQPTIHRILNGTECAYSIGKKIEIIKPRRKTKA